VARGYGGATIPEIARNAGVSPATCYLYFDSKEALANALAQRWMGEVLERLAPILDDPEPRPELHVALMRSMLEFGREHPLAYAFMARAADAPYADDTTKALFESLARKERAAFQRYVDAGLLAGIGVQEVRALSRGHARELVDMARAGIIELTDEVIDRAAWMSWDALAATTKLQRGEREHDDG
jgi:AcrR family transcriptional regulator